MPLTGIKCTARETAGKHFLSPPPLGQGDSYRLVLDLDTQQRGREHEPWSPPKSPHRPGVASSSPVCPLPPSARRPGLTGFMKSSTMATGSWLGATRSAYGC